MHITSLHNQATKLANGEQEIRNKKVKNSQNRATEHKVEQILGFFNLHGRILVRLVTLEFGEYVLVESLSDGSRSEGDFLVVRRVWVAQPQLSGWVQLVGTNSTGRDGVSWSGWTWLARTDSTDGVDLWTWLACTNSTSRDELGWQGWTRLAKWTLSWLGERDSEDRPAIHLLQGNPWQYDKRVIRWSHQ
ncbi:hypothetical protein CR513_44577, partial [Mucuna pruriens]